jgi:hypothetical protein
MGSVGGGLVGLGLINLVALVLPHVREPGIVLPIIFGLEILGGLLGKAATR